MKFTLFKLVELLNSFCGITKLTEEDLESQRKFVHGVIILSVQ